jgi:hypothetical protein
MRICQPPEELLGVAAPIFFVETQARKNGTNLRFNCVAVARAEFVLDAMKSLCHLVVLWGSMVKL